MNIMIYMYINGIIYSTLVVILKTWLLTFWVTSMELLFPDKLRDFRPISEMFKPQFLQFLNGDNICTHLRRLF